MKGAWEMGLQDHLVYEEPKLAHERVPRWARVMGRLHDLGCSEVWAERKGLLRYKIPFLLAPPCGSRGSIR